jgi:hypothetical protein
MITAFTTIFPILFSYTVHCALRYEKAGKPGNAGNP